MPWNQVIRPRAFHLELVPRAGGRRQTGFTDLHLFHRQVSDNESESQTHWQSRHISYECIRGELFELGTVEPKCAISENAKHNLAEDASLLRR